jgi:hypothetical protein
MAMAFARMLAPSECLAHGSRVIKPVAHLHYPAKCIGPTACLFPEPVKRDVRIGVSAGYPARTQAKGMAGSRRTCHAHAPCLNRDGHGTVVQTYVWRFIGAGIERHDCHYGLASKSRMPGGHGD